MFALLGSAMCVKLHIWWKKTKGSTSPPSGNQVDGLPSVFCCFSVLFVVFIVICSSLCPSSHLSLFPSLFLCQSASLCLSTFNFIRFFRFLKFFFLIVIVIFTTSSRFLWTCMWYCYFFFIVFVFVLIFHSAFVSELLSIIDYCFVPEPTLLLFVLLFSLFVSFFHVIVFYFALFCFRFFVNLYLTRIFLPFFCCYVCFSFSFSCASVSYNSDKKRKIL